MKKLAVLLALWVAAVVPCSAEPGYFKLSLWDRTAVAIPNNIYYITGVDLGFGSYTHTMTGFQWDIAWAESTQLRGVSWAFGISKTADGQGVQFAAVSVSDKFAGVQFSGVNMTQDLTGVQFGGINMSGHSATGAQLGFVNMDTTLLGGQLGGFNVSNQALQGAQVGFVNMANRYMEGAQIGFYNQADSLSGFQFGLLNYAKNIYGLQLGLINIAENGVLPAMVFVNGRF